jgi:RNA polymerase sigma-70 factor (ECF subfamily)
MQDISDDILVRASRGDTEAFKIIYDAASGFVYNVVYRVVGHKEDAEEVTQEVFLTVYHKLKDFRFQSSFKTWVYRVAVNSAINYAKKVSKERNRTVEYDEQLNAVGVPEEARAEMDRGVYRRTVDELLSKLNPEQRACVVLRNIEGLSYQEIAEALKININTVRSRLKRGRESLLALRKEVVSHEL